MIVRNLVRRLSATGMNTAPRTLSYNPAENAILMTFDAEGGSYELHILPKDPGRGDSFSVSQIFVFAFLCCMACLIEGTDRRLASHSTKKT